MPTREMRRIEAVRGEFLAYRVSCPDCRTALGPRFVIREHLDVPPDPPYAATVRCATCGMTLEVVFV